MLAPLLPPHPELVVAWDEEDGSKGAGQHAQRALQHRQVVGDVAGHQDGVLLVLAAGAQALQPAGGARGRVVGWEVREDRPRAAGGGEGGGAWRGGTPGAPALGGVAAPGAVRVAELPAAEGVPAASGRAHHAMLAG